MKGISLVQSLIVVLFAVAGFYFLIDPIGSGDEEELGLSIAIALFLWFAGLMIGRYWSPERNPQSGTSSFKS